MSDVSGGPDWWLASDGRWYPPESRPAPPPPPDPTRYPTPGGLIPSPSPGQYPAPMQPAPQYYVAVPPPVVMMEPQKSKTSAALLCFFLGGLGIHRFYTGQAGLGIALLLQTLILVPLTLGIWALVVIVWVIIDFILILTGSVTDKYGRPLI